MARSRVSDEVWAQLDPKVDRLSRRDRRLAGAAALIVIVLVAVGILARESGALWPRLSDGGSWSGGYDLSGHTFTETTSVHNEGWQSVHVSGAAADSAGIAVTSMDGLPAEVPAGATVTITVRYAVTNCAAVNSGFVPIVVRVERWWGTATVRLAPMTAGSGGPAFSACHGP